MLVTTYSEARKTFSYVLDRAKSDGAVLIRRADGSVFRLTPEDGESSPFEGVSTPIRLPVGTLSVILSDLKDSNASRLVPDK